MITLLDVTKKFGERTILDRISVTFERGCVTALLGPSGGGKSTLLRCIDGLERIDEGKISVGDVELGPPGRRSGAREERQMLVRLRLKVGMVFQHYSLFAHKTALENVIEAPVHVRKVPLAEATKRARELLERVGLTHRERAYPRELSGGEQQRVAIARALAMDPDVLLLDEPTGALDPMRKTEVVRLLRSIAEDGMTMIIVTHEAAVAEDLAERALFLRQGRIERDGAPGEVLSPSTRFLASRSAASDDDDDD